MKQSNMTIKPTIIVVSMNPFRDVRRESLSQANRKFLVTLLSLVLVLIMLGGACRKQPAAVEIKGPILAMTTATGFDDKGIPQNPSFAFAPTEPQLVVIVQVGKLDAGSQARASSASFIPFEIVAAAATEPVLNIAWYRISDEGEQKLFEHQIPVRTYDRAYSIGKSKGRLRAGGYKVKASLAGQTQEIELKVREAKAETSSGALPQARVIKASAVESEGNAGEGETPADGGSGTIPHSSEASAASGACRIRITSGEDLRADTVGFMVTQACPNDSDYGPVDVLAGMGMAGVWTSVGRLEGAPTMGVQLKSFGVNPCLLEYGKDLPGHTVNVYATTGVNSSLVYITLGPDQDAPKVSVNSSPPKGTKVKAGDVIKIDATASERRSGGTWQTGVQRFQLVRKGPGGGIEELIQEVTDPSRLPKPCGSKSWSKVIDASYTVPQDPPPVIKLCAIAEDYAGNENSKCADFPTGDVWKGTMNSETGITVPGNRCSDKWETQLTFVVDANGAVTGTATGTRGLAPNCEKGYAGPAGNLVSFKIEGQATNQQIKVRLSAISIASPGFVVGFHTLWLPEPQTLTIPITGPNTAEAVVELRTSGGIAGVASSQNVIRLTCETCAP